jgi:hypothetical protein
MPVWAASPTEEEQAFLFEGGVSGLDISGQSNHEMGSETNHRHSVAMNAAAELVDPG